MVKWEYRSEYIATFYSESESPDDFIHSRSHPGYFNLWQQKLEAALNKIGSEGWELVAIEPRIVCGEGIENYALFKRPKNDG